MAHRKRRGGLPKSKEIETPGWMLTFGDMNSLLLTFFVLLISLSVPRQPKMKEVIVSLNNAFGPQSKSAADIMKTRMPLHKAQGVVDMPVVRRFEFQREVEDRIHEKGFGPHAQFEKTPEGFRLRIRETLLYEPGGTELQPGGVAFVALLAPLIRDSDFFLRIEGHTDSRPFRTEAIPSNWELSALRAVSVLDAIRQLSGIDAGRLSAVGYGEHRPVAPNDTTENRARNRRVDVYFLEPSPLVQYPDRTWAPGSSLPIPTLAPPPATPRERPASGGPAHGRGAAGGGAEAR